MTQNIITDELAELECATTDMVHGNKFCQLFFLFGIALTMLSIFLMNVNKLFVLFTIVGLFVLCYALYFRHKLDKKMAIVSKISKDLKQRLSE